MKSLLAIGLLAAVSGLALPALADDSAQNKVVCLRSYEINHTRIVDDQTILFFMRGNKVWKNTLVARCPTLRNNTRGFTYAPTNPATTEICSNLFTIRVNDSGEVCLPGVFTPVEPPPRY
jgi:hypothetical protein